jgi:Domain of unknown function (DUF4214)
VLTINDNDTTATASNPIDDASFFVHQRYLDFLNREPDDAGLQFWTNGITSCGSDTNCVAVKRINASAAFFFSIEFQETGYLVYRFYKTAYGDANGNSTLGGAHQLPMPVIRLREFLRDTQRIGQGVVVNQGDWQTQLENNKQAFALEFVQQQRFMSAFPPTLTAADFVSKLDQNAGSVLTADAMAAARKIFFIENVTLAPWRRLKCRRVTFNERPDRMNSPANAPALAETFPRGACVSRLTSSWLRRRR